MASAEFQQLASLATKLAEKSKDEKGFVAVHELAKHFRAEIQLRPLLVEGMIAKPKQPESPWLVIIDTETHSVTLDSIASESSGRPLSSRLRNTIAHELAHTLSFRMDEFRLEGGKGTREEIVQRLERETERLSPLLLIPQSALDEVTRGRVTIEALAGLRAFWAVSSQVLVSRFELLREVSAMTLQGNALQNLAIGIGTWKNQNTVECSTLHFRQFSEFVPEFLQRLRNKQHVSLTEIFNDSNFVLNGGNNLETNAVVPAGTTKSPTSDTLSVAFYVEECERKAGNSFLWVLQNARV